MPKPPPEIAAKRERMKMTQLISCPNCKGTGFIAGSDSMGAKLRALRLGKNKTLDDVAEAVGMSKTYLWTIEKDRAQSIGFNVVMKLAKYYGIDPSALYSEEMK